MFPEVVLLKEFEDRLTLIPRALSRKTLLEAMISIASYVYLCVCVCVYSLFVTSVEKVSRGVVEIFSGIDV